MASLFRQEVARNADAASLDIDEEVLERGASGGPVELWAIGRERTAAAAAAAAAVGC